MFVLLDRIEVVLGDITQCAVDAIVNAANEQLLGGGGVDGAIHQAAGPELKSACYALNGCEVGQSKITGAYRLPAKYVIHTVGPRWHGGAYREEDLLASCYQTSLQLALERQCKTIAYPAISCGVYGFPVQRATDIAIREVTRFLKKEDSIQKVYFVCFEEAVFEVYQTQWELFLAAEYSALQGSLQGESKVEPSEREVMINRLISEIKKRRPQKLKFKRKDQFFRS